MYVRRLVVSKNEWILYGNVSNSVLLRNAGNIKSRKQRNINIKEIYLFEFYFEQNTYKYRVSFIIMQ